MRNWAENIIPWQDKLLRIAKFQEQLEAIPAQKGEAQKQYAAETDALNQAIEKRKQLELQNRTLDKEIDAIRTKQNDFKAKSALIKNNDDYKRAIIQIEQCNTAVSEIENQQLEIMEKIELANKDVETCQQAVQDGKKRAADIVADLDDKITRLKGAIARLEAELPELEAAVEPEYHQQYLRLRNAPNLPKSAPIVVPLINDTCGRCRIQVTSQEITHIKNGKMVICPSCQAMLYYEK